MTTIDARGRKPGVRPSSTSKSAALRPRDAATLIMVDRALGVPRILLGRRRPDMKFMPGKYVFPGGRVDRADRYVEASDELAEHETQRLMVDMKGGPSAIRARCLALAAVRETWEEAGIIIGAPAGEDAKVPTDASWRTFHDQGFSPRLSPLTFFARAITPPGRPRRFDTRFFCVEALNIAHQTTPPDDELSDLVWMSIDDARDLDLPPITRVILEDLRDRMGRGALTSPNAAVPYYFNRNGTFKRELITAPGDASST
ncbi:MAG: NUDIX hydrolase [Hyphomicrobiaceae bacterium]